MCIEIVEVFPSSVPPPPSRLFFTLLVMALRGGRQFKRRNKNSPNFGGETLETGRWKRWIFSQNIKYCFILRCFGICNKIWFAPLPARERISRQVEFPSGCTLTIQSHSSQITCSVSCLFHSCRRIAIISRSLLLSLNSSLPSMSCLHRDAFTMLTRNYRVRLAPKLHYI